MTKYNVLIVDDEPIQLKVIGRFVEGLGYNLFTMNSGMEVVDFFVSKKAVKGVSCDDTDVILLDLSMPDLDGFDVMRKIEKIRGDTQIIVLTANNDVALATAALNTGALDYIVKGEKDFIARLTSALRNAIDKKYLKYLVSHLDRLGKNRVIFSDILGKNREFCDAINLAQKASSSLIPVLIEGGSGSGKELLARAIHGSGPRAGKPFIVVECDLLAGDGAEEKIFGSDKALSDGEAKNIGKLREANHGTIFFKRIEALKYETQVKLLRFMREGEFVPVDGKSPVPANVRIISATTHDLKKMVMTKKVREDFFYCISTFLIKIPSLKDRGAEDIKILANNFCRDFCISENRRVKTVSDRVLKLLCDYDWKGNVRQLKNIIFRAVVFCDGDVLEPEDFPHLLNNENNIVTKSNAVTKKKVGLRSELIDIFDDGGRCKTIDVIEEEVVRILLEIFSGNLSEVSKQLGIGRSTIYRKLKTINDGEV